MVELNSPDSVAVKPANRKWFARLIILSLIIGISGSLWFVRCSHNWRLDPLTVQHSEEMTVVLNHYMEITHLERERMDALSDLEHWLPDEQGRAACEQIAIGEGLARCLSTITYRSMGDSQKQVTRVRVFEYETDCAVVAGSFQSAFQTSGLFLLRKIEDVWKIADDYVAVGYTIDGDNEPHYAFGERNPPLPFSCVDN